MKWTFNCIAEFENDKKKSEVIPVKWEKSKWRHPNEALEKIIIDKEKNMVRLQLMYNKEKQNIILKQAGEKLVKKDKRKLIFGDLATCRDFVFHCRRLHHLKNFVQAGNMNA